jgi:uncharacterized membrane protein YdjX (TVP38/TMEM64 family)
MKTDFFLLSWFGASKADAPTDSSLPTAPKRFWPRPWVSVVVAVVAVVGALLLWQYGSQLQALINDRARFQAMMRELGWLGPLVLIAFNALQIVVAPVPGYVVQLVAGFLYGPWWGGLWSTIGLFIGSMTAMWLARTYGRPLVARVIGAQRLAHWEHVIHSDSIYIWFILLLGPTGDAPYYLAGLSRIRFVQVALITLLIRVPSVFVAAAVGAGAMTLTWWQLMLVLVAVGIGAFVLLRYKNLLKAWVNRLLQPLAQRYLPEHAASPDAPHSPHHEHPCDP